MAQINIRIDDDLKNNAETLFADLGLNITTAINMFIRQAVRQRGIPFEVTKNADPFWNDANQAHLRKVIAEFESGKGKFIEKTIEELEAMEE
ncbi:MAG: type II toxin-antitoxin system RelB/DinJ family antitoxin [Oscillospiraceae bacterium]|nr:type II toxin-antitoxin system RelB/DinJ family antitoxin [Oscillospiraceae bacterium]